MNNNIVVLKFGGTSMGTADSIKECVSIVVDKIKTGKRPFVVVSAVSKVTDVLLKMLELAKNNEQERLTIIFTSIRDRHFEILQKLSDNKELTKKYEKILNKKFSRLYDILKGIVLLKDYSEKTQAIVASYGEDLSSELMELCLVEHGINAKKIDSAKFILTDDNYLSSNVDLEQTGKNFKTILKKVNEGTTFVMTGFYGKNLNNEITLLGRGGSDFSGSIAGIGLRADVVEIWTDVDGVMSADPRIVEDAVVWNRLNRDIASEMARAGAKVLHPKTIVASFYGINIVIKNSFNRNAEGTIVDTKDYGDGVKGIVSDDEYSIVHLENQNMFGNVGFIADVGETATDNGIPIDMVTTSETSVSFTVKTNMLDDEALSEFSDISNVEITDDVAKISVIGQNIVNSRILSTIFSALDKNKIEVFLVTVSQSKNNIGIIVKENDKDKTINTLHNDLINKELQI
jgi:aspartate kinase